MKAVILCVGVLLSVGACKKSGGSGWLVGSSGMMLNVQSDGAASGYNTATTETLTRIACRFANEAWVVGGKGTVLYTSDAGASWQPQPVPTSADLRALATQDIGPVFIAGNGVFLMTTDTGTHWTAFGDGQTNFRSVAAAQDAETVLAVSDDGGLWSFENRQLISRGSIPGARAVAVSPDGKTAFLVGDNLISKSLDGGRTWTPLSASERVVYDDVRVDASGQAVAVGAVGAIAHIAFDGSIVMQHLGTADLHTIHIADVGEDYESLGFAGGDGGQVWITRDGGWSWIQGPNAGQTVLGIDEIGDSHN